MNKTGPIVIIEDDIEDQELLTSVFAELNYPNKIVFFGDGDQALQYLQTFTEQPFLILSDVNLPKLDGFKLRDKIHNNEQLRLKCIPYLFFTTSADQKHVIDAYSKSIQGFFTKPGSYGDLVRVIRNIIEYWKDCHSPNIV
ncbi:MAG TPA: response regulator [Chitinophagaceae bacterium]|nr:response regulator [Chitinophagaceae bacterium]